MERKYLCRADDGHDFFEFEFYSKHRANSKANHEDARNEYRSQHGRRSFKILDTVRYDVYW